MKIKESVSKDICAGNLLRKTIKELNKLDSSWSNSHNYEYWQVQLYKASIKARKIRHGQKTVYDVFARFNPLTCKIYVYESPAYNICKKIGEKLEYKEIIRCFEGE